MDDLLHSFYFFKILGVLKFLSEGIVRFWGYFGKLFNRKDIINIAIGAVLKIADGLKV